MTLSAADYWQLIHVERARLASVLQGLRDDQWRVRSLCSGWTVEEAVSHLTAAANTGTIAWLRSMAFAGFKPERHNARRLAEYLGRTPEETLDNFRRSIARTTAPTKDYPGWLGEVIVHSQDVAMPLGLDLVPDRLALQEVAKFFSTKDFAVNSRMTVTGLSLGANDADFTAGSGPTVRGPLLKPGHGYGRSAGILRPFGRRRRRHTPRKNQVIGPDYKARDAFNTGTRASKARRR